MRALTAVALLALASGCGRPACGEGTRYDEARDECVAAPSELPVGQASHETDLRVTLQADGSYLLGASPVDEETLRTRVQRRVGAAMHPVHVTLVAPEELPHARVVAAIDRLRSWGVDRVELEVAAPPAPGAPG